MTHTPTPWTYRPHHHDDWGWIRGPSTDGKIAPLVATARSGAWESAEMFDQHRAYKTDPYAANAAFIVRACNNHDALVKALADLLAWCKDLNDFRPDSRVGRNATAALSAARALLPAATDSLAIVPNSQAKTEVEG